MRCRLSTIRPVWLLAITASATGLLIYALGDYGAPDLIKYSVYLYSTFALVVACANLPRTVRYLLRKTKHSRAYCKIKELLFSLSPDTAVFY